MRGIQATRRPRTVLVGLVLVVGIMSGSIATAAPTDGQKCESAIQSASAKFVNCRLAAESKDARMPDPARLASALAKCSEKFESAFASAVARFGDANCTAATPIGIEDGLAQCCDGAVGASAPSAGVPTCGNGVVDLVGEQCDGADLDGEGCGSIGFAGGQLGCDGSCRFDTTACVAPDSCGNGSVEAPEQCDGAALGVASCASLGYSGGTLACTDGCAFDRGGCTPFTTDERFPATAQLSCWDVNGNPIACAGTGQDGDVRAGAAQSFVDNGDGTITDLNTRLTWEKLSDDGSVHDKDATWDWAQAFSVKLASLNAGAGFAGHTDWRLPNLRELVTLVDHEANFPSVPPVFRANCGDNFSANSGAGCTVLSCSCTWPGTYWTSTTVPGYPDNAWAVFFDDGANYGEVKTSGNSGSCSTNSCKRRVRAVRSAG
ncbi:MAG: DUF1566 domain-containing protein [Alphaproteobacteria bacterium]